jgi:hypothetical protein
VFLAFGNVLICFKRIQAFLEHGIPSTPSKVVALMRKVQFLTLSSTAFDVLASWISIF